MGWLSIVLRRRASSRGEVKRLSRIYGRRRLVLLHVTARQLDSRPVRGRFLSKVLTRGGRTGGRRCGAVIGVGVVEGTNLARAIGQGG